MLNSDPRKLRFFGIDLHSRGRRRCLVALTYAVFVIAMGVIAEEIKSVAALQSYHDGFWLMLIVSSVIPAVSIFREGGPVKRFTEPVWRLRGAKGGWVLLRNLDDRAKYKYGDCFDALPAEQQKELLRTYKVGNYFFPADASKAPSRLDEREAAERDHASSRTLAWLTGYCFILAVIYAFSRTRMHPEDLASIFLILGFFARTGPKASILWNEPDPHVDGDPQLAQHSLT